MKCKKCGKEIEKNYTCVCDEELCCECCACEEDNSPACACECKKNEDEKK